MFNAYRKLIIIYFMFNSFLCDNYITICYVYRNDKSYRICRSKKKLKLYVICCLFLLSSVLEKCCDTYVYSMCTLPRAASTVYRINTYRYIEPIFV